MFMKMQGIMTKVAIEGLDEEHRLGVFSRDFLHRLRIEQSKPNGIKRILRIIPQKLIDRSKLVNLCEPSDRPIFITNYDPVGTGRLRIILHG